MLCLYCSAATTKGFLEHQLLFHPLKWSPAARQPGLFSATTGNIKLTSSREGGRIAVWRCAACRKMVIDEDAIEH